MLVSSEIIKEIAEQLDCGFTAYFHKQSHELIFIPNENELYDIDMDEWGEDLNKIEENYDDYFKIEKWDSKFAFDVMVGFTELPTLSPKVKNKLIKALNQKGAFKHFKYEIDQLDEERKEWFAFKNKSQKDYVLEELRALYRLEG